MFNFIRCETVTSVNSSSFINLTGKKTYNTQLTYCINILSWQPNTYLTPLSVDPIISGIKWESVSHFFSVTRHCTGLNALPCREDKLSVIRCPIISNQQRKKFGLKIHIRDFHVIYWQTLQHIEFTIKFGSSLHLETLHNIPQGYQQKFWLAIIPSAQKLQFDTSTHTLN